LFRLHDTVLSRTLQIAGGGALIVLIFTAARAQDMRRVTEPTFPPTCAVLRAHWVAAGGGRTLAAADEDEPDTRRIQNAIDHCAAGHAVELDTEGSKDAFLSGPLDLRAGVTLRIGGGAILFGSRNPRDYDNSPGACGVLSASGRGCKALINADYVDGAGVMGPGVIDGRGWARLRGGKLSWWGLAEQARLQNSNQNCPFLIFATHSNNFTLYRVVLKNAPMYHVLYRNGNGFTAWGVIINTPQTARNTDGIDPLSASNVTITHGFIHAGDDDVSIKAGDGGPSSHITVANNHFYTGHGMSIGSDTNGGVSDVFVQGLTIDGADNGLRIKSNISRGGLVDNVVYRNVCIRDTKHPILMDTHYSFYGEARNEIPTFKGIVFENIRILSPGRITLDGYDRHHRLGITFDNVILNSPNEIEILARHAAISLGTGPVNFRPSGEDVTVTGKPGKGRPYDCTAKFPPLPGHP
jgi:polygalacturonase